MKKIFTLISVALAAMSVNAQEWTADVDYVAAPGGTQAAEFTGAVASGTNLIATIDKSPIKLEYVASKDPKEIGSADGGAAGLTPDKWPDAGWNNASFKVGGNNKESQPTLGEGFYPVIGSGVPYTTFVSKQFWNADNGFADRYYPGFKADGDTDGWTYYNPDGSTGLPTSGAYIKASTTTAGVMKIGCFVQNGNTRQLYIARESDKKALTWTNDNNTTEYKIEGYAQSLKNSDNTWVFVNSMPVEDYLIGSTTDYTWTDAVTGESKSASILNSRKFIWFVFDAKVGETYYIFGKNWQIGFQGVKFYSGKSIKDYGGETAISTVKTAAESADAPIYNLAGQKVDKSFKGVVIQNGKKVVMK